MSTPYDFHVSMDHLQSLRRSLADLETALGAAHAHTWPDIDPKLHTGPAAWRTEKNDSATYVYGLLNEADPLGDIHADVVHRLQDWYQRIHEMVTAMTTYAQRTHETYTAADEAIAMAAMRVAEGGSVGADVGGLRTRAPGATDASGASDVTGLGTS